MRDVMVQGECVQTGFCYCSDPNDYGVMLISKGTSPMAAAPQSLGLPNNPTTPTDPVFTKSTGSQYAPQTPLSSQPPNLSNSCASGAPFVKNGAQQCLWHIKITPGSPKRNKYKSKFKWGPAMVRNTKPAWRSGMRDNPRGQRHDLYNISAKHTPKKSKPAIWQEWDTTAPRSIMVPCPCPQSPYARPLSATSTGSSVGLSFCVCPDGSHCNC
ncbi:uncharacterized protein LOC142355672 isoform X2 [Convolutriloba macropyga]|uniref:uncharacterized protein LOC142355672 isoform X2 n=1 Tax=Convolutriloba macropyga TaxID=536237 RepID=UPI003F521383